MKEIILLHNEITLISDEDYDYINQFNWYLSDSGYAIRTIYDPNVKSINIFLHHIVIEKKGLIIPNNMEVDHKDRNKLNNQHENLRIVTRSVNTFNRNIQPNNTSGVKGVGFSSYYNKYRAYIKINGTMIHLGYFLTFEEAIAARLKAEQKYKRYIQPI